MITTVWEAESGTVEDAIAEVRLAQCYLASVQRLLIARDALFNQSEQELFNQALCQIASALDGLKTLTAYK